MQKVLANRFSCLGVVLPCCSHWHNIPRLVNFLPVASWAGWQLIVCAHLCCCALSPDMSGCIISTPELVSLWRECFMCLSSTSSRGHLVQMQFPELAHGHEAKSKDPTVKWAAGSWMTAKKGWALPVLSERLLWDLGLRLCLTQSSTSCCRCWQCWPAHSAWNFDTFSEYG